MKKRLDVVLEEKGIYPSREKAKQAILLGRVLVNGVRADKPSMQVDEDGTFDCLPFEFVSRGGFKLQKAIEEFAISLAGKVVLDIGASTGGFTDVCLQNGASKVYCIDTGEGQLNEKIKNDPRVTNYEKTNYLLFDKTHFEDVDFLCVDVSFVSLSKLAPKLAKDFVEEGKKTVDLVLLIKPQFECGAEYARKHKGVVKDEKMHKKIVQNLEQLFAFVGFKVQGTIPSPIKGGDGNVEFLIHLKTK